MKRLHLGAGRHHLEGWENHDREVDITRPLPWDTGAADFIFAEHVIEHVLFQEGIGFLEECFRVLKRGGVLRLSFPDAHKIASLPFRDLQDYATMLERKGVLTADPNDRGAMTRECMRAVFTGWGHLSAWNEELAWCVLLMHGFDLIHFPAYGDSVYDELRGIDGHHTAPNVGDAAKLETTIVEAVRP